MDGINFLSVLSRIGPLYQILVRFIRVGRPRWRPVGCNIDGGNFFRVLEAVVDGLVVLFVIERRVANFVLLRMPGRSGYLHTGYIEAGRGC